jgi:CrcB protein
VNMKGAFAHERRPLFRMPVHPAWLLAIFAGGAIGTALRAIISALYPHTPAQFPWATFAINTAGSLILGALLEYLSVSGPDQGWRRFVRLGVGTGVLGGFTTYSSFAVEAISAVADGAARIGVVYALASPVVGVAAALAGLTVARSIFQATEQHRNNQ